MNWNKIRLLLISIFSQSVLLFAECDPEFTYADDYSEEAASDDSYVCCTVVSETWESFLDGPWYNQGGNWENLNCALPGVWFPEEPALFKPLLADPRQVCYSIGWRFDDQALHKNIADVSFGDSLAIYEWCNFGPWCGRLRVEIEGAVWAVFSPSQESAPLVNADYYVGFPITYAFDRWAFRLRGYHISSHIGDEFLLMHPTFGRLNPSAEYLDFFVSHDLVNDIRVYGGIGWIVSQDESFECSPFFGAAGVEVRLQSLGGIDWCNLMYGTPFYGMHLRYSKDFKNHVDMTYVLGYEWGKFTGLARKVRIYAQYHDGYSVDGQFCRSPTNYFSLRASYSY